MKLYTDLNIPLWKWDKIQKSQQNGNIDLRYLCKKDKLPKKYNKKEYSKAYLEILYQIPEMDLTLNNAWITYAGELVKYNIRCEMNIWRRKLLERKEEKIQVNKLNKAFDNYLTELENSYKEFEFNIHSLRKDYKDVWDLEIKIPDILIKNDGLQFFLAEEYIGMIKEWIIDNKITLDESLKLMTTSFYTKFIHVETVKISNLRKVNKRLYEFFRDSGDIEKWRLIRGDFFNLNKMDFVPKNESTILKQIIKLREINKQDILLRGENACTLKEYYEQINTAAEKEKAALKREKQRSGK